MRELLSFYARAEKLLSYDETMLTAKLDDAEIPKAIKTKKFDLITMIPLGRWPSGVRATEALSRDNQSRPEGRPSPLHRATPGAHVAATVLAPPRPPSLVPPLSRKSPADAGRAQQPPEP